MSFSVVAEGDKARRELAEAKNQAEALTHKAEQDLKEHGEALSDEQKQDIEDAVKAVREEAEGEDAEAITAKIQTLTEAVMKMGEAIYANQSGDEDGPPSQADDAEDEDIVDAEFEDVDEDDKA